MSSTAEAGLRRIGNGDDRPAIVQEEEVSGLPRDELPEHDTRDQGRLTV